MDAIDEFFQMMDGTLTAEQEAHIQAMREEDDRRAAELEEIRKPWVAAAAERLNCTRCGGTGYLPQYRHVEMGACFKCS